MATKKRLIDLDVAIEKIKDEGVLGEGHAEYERIADVCDMLEECPTVDAVEVLRDMWIPVTERLPEKNTRVLACLVSKITVVAIVRDNNWLVAWNNSPCQWVTHWMPLPEPPRGDA